MFLLMPLFLSFLLISVEPASAQQALPEKPPIPADNPMTKSKIELGKQLYFDPRLSSTGTVSCNSCHNVMSGGGDSRVTSAGVDGQLGGRNSPTVWNSAFLSVQFWDGRAVSLEEQAKGPLTNPIEMGMPSHQVVMERISQIPGYQASFKEVFGKNGMTIDNAAKAIAAFERTLITPNSRFDRYLKGEKKALTEKEIAGFETFKTVGCVACHSGVNFAGPALPEGTGFFMKFPTYPDQAIEKKYAFQKDLGRMEATEKEEDKNMWRVPTLRNVAVTAPYFHNGSVNDLKEAIRIMGKTQLNKDLEAGQIEKLAAFLNTLTGEFPEISMPRLPETENFSTVAN